MKPRLVTNLGSIGGAPDPTTAPEVHTGMRKLHADQGYSQGNQPVPDDEYSIPWKLALHGLSL